MHVSYSENTGELEKSLGYRFKKKELLKKALIHKSFHHENPNEAFFYNERLEFLGDSVLGLIISEMLFSFDKGLTEADMSKMKSYIVKEAVLYEIASGICLGSYLRLGKGEDSTGGRQKKSIISDAFEALIGAVFLDSDYRTVKQVVLKLFSEKIDSVVNKNGAYDFKSELQEKSQALFGVLPEYRIVNQEGEEHRKIFTAEVYINGTSYGRGEGKSKKDAQMTAAREAMGKLS
jgi:ribonuclease-3